MSPVADWPMFMRKIVGDFIMYFLVPWTGSTIAFLILMWWRDPTYSGLLITGSFASLVLGVFCFLAYLALQWKGTSWALARLPSGPHSCRFRIRSGPFDSRPALQIDSKPFVQITPA